MDAVGRRAAAGCDDGILYLWDLDGGPLRRLAGHEGFVNGVRFHPEQPLLVSGGQDHTVRIWNSESGELLNTLEGHGDVVLRSAVDPLGRRLASVRWDGTVRLRGVEEESDP